MADPTALRPKVAIVHDWLVGGGAELVVEQLHKMYPDAPIYTSYATDEWRERLDGRVRTGWLQPLGRFRKLLPLLRIIWFSSLRLDAYDLVLSSSGAEAKGVRTPRRTLHINYCHAPTHYYWNRYEQYMRQPGFGRFDWLARFGLKLLVGPLRRWDYRAAQRPDIIIANSRFTQSEVQKYYGRESLVVHPPVDVARFAKAATPSRQGYIISGRQTPYKRFDIAIEACTELGLPLTVIGNGPDHERLRRLAGPSVTFAGRIADTALPAALGTAQAFIFPGIDDFGISAVEALAAGTPIIAFKGGGALDYVVPGQTGEFFDRPDAASLAEALRQFDPKRYTVSSLQAKAAECSPDRFQTRMQTIIDDNLKQGA